MKTENRRSTAVVFALLPVSGLSIPLAGLFRLEAVTAGWRTPRLPELLSRSGRNPRPAPVALSGAAHHSRGRGPTAKPRACRGSRLLAAPHAPLAAASLHRAGVPFEDQGQVLR